MLPFCRAVAAAGFMFAMTAQAPVSEPNIAVLDQRNGFGGISFGCLDTQVSGLTHIPSGIGKRWRATKLFMRQSDTTTISGQPVIPTYWFRNHHFVGVTIDISLIQADAILAGLKWKYGPSQRDTVEVETQYWLGTRTYILYERTYPKSRGWELHIGSLAMLNEQVVETAVRRQARATLGWQPDSLGLPRQFPR